MTTVDPWAAIAAVFGDNKPPTPPTTPRVYTTRVGSTYAQVALDNEANNVVGAQPGSRNHTLNAAAFSLGQLVAGGVLDEADVVQTLTHAARQCGLDEDEIPGTIASGLRGGAKEPRGVPEQPDVDGWLNSLPTQPEPTVDPDTGEVTDPPTVERTSWWPRDLAGLLAGDVEEEPAPAFLARSDGQRLFYAGKVNALIGESESGKTWVGLLAVVQALGEGQPVLMLDFEDTLHAVTARLRSLGATDAHLSHLTYISPDEAFDVPQKRDLREAIQARPPTLVLFDGVNAAMTLLGLDLEKNKDATAFSLQLLRPLKRTGACVVTIDHVTKSKDNRGSYAIGAQAKRADIDGCALMVEVVQPFGRGMTGRLKLTVSKDRPGHVRAVSAGAKNAGTAVLASHEDGTVQGRVEAPDLRPADERGPFRPTVLMERVSRYLEPLADSPGLSKTAIEEGVTGNAAHLRTAVACLVQEGFVEATEVAGKPRYRFIRPFIESDYPMADSHPSSRPDPSSTRPRTGSNDPSSRPPSFRGTGDGLDGERETGPESWWQR